MSWFRAADRFDLPNSRTAIVLGALISGLSGTAQRPGGSSIGSSITSGNPSWPLRLSRPEDPGRIYERVRFVTVSSRLSPKHYGVAVFEDFDPTKELHRRGRAKMYDCPQLAPRRCSSTQHVCFLGVQDRLGNPSRSR